MTKIWNTSFYSKIQNSTQWQTANRSSKYDKQKQITLLESSMEKIKKKRSKDSSVNFSSIDEVILVKLLFSLLTSLFSHCPCVALLDLILYVQWKIPQWKLQLYLNKWHSYATSLLQQLHFGKNAMLLHSQPCMPSKSMVQFRKLKLFG